MERNILDISDNEECYKLYQNKNTNNRKKLNISAITKALNNKKSLIICSKHLIRKNHFTPLHKLYNTKRIPVKCEKSTLDSISCFNDLFKNECNNNNEIINESIKINLDNFENIIKNRKTIYVRLMKLILNNIEDKFMKIKIVFERCKNIYENSNCQNTVIKLISDIEELFNKIDNYISYITKKEKEIKLNEIKIINSINNQFQEIKRNCDNIINNLLSIKESINKIIENLLLINVIPYLKATIELFIEKKKISYTLLQNDVVLNKYDNESIIKFETIKELGFTKLQKVSKFSYF